MSKEFNDLINEANKTYLENFPNTTCFERAVFFSWSCQLEECCKYCYMSTLPKEKRTNDRIRSFASLLAETILCKQFGWDYGFLSGGINALPDEKVLDLLKKTNEIIGKKIWINIGTLDEKQLLKYKPYIHGIIGTVEILDPKLHKEICPSKPLKKVEDMFKIANKLNLKTGMTLIVGLGETIHDFMLLKEFINKYKIEKIHIYGLNLQKGTIFENSTPPTAEYQAEWIALTRLNFPKIDIQCGIWKDRTNRVELLLRAGANSISKYPVLKEFGTKKSTEIESQAKLANREFTGTITQNQEFDWKKIINNYSFDQELKDQIYEKLLIYIKKFKKNI